jgi:hypothetical protein
VVTVPAHTFSLGSTPGDDGRDPTLEPYLVDTALREAAMDALPYPNDPAKPPRTGVTRFEAERLCSEAGARLCTEVEWEAACKGPLGDRYASGAVWDTSCESDASSCGSGYGVRAMGAMREWTASALGGVPILRGAKGDDRAPGAHACARRTRGTDARLADVGFRCCKGGDPAQAMPPIEKKPAFRPVAREAVDLVRLFADLPELASTTEPRLFDASAAGGIADAGPRDLTFTTSPLLFSPEPGTELLVVAGRGASSSFVVALHVLRGGKHRLAAAFLMPGDTSPVALAYRPDGATLAFTSCFRCPGRTGTVVVENDHRVRIIAQSK